MKLARRLSLPVAGVLILLQRTPLLRLAAGGGEFSAPSQIVSLLRSAVATTASLGAVHSLAGATRFVVSAPTVLGTVGVPITPVVFTVTGASIPPGSFRINGTLPPGVIVPNALPNGILNFSTGTITGTPTASGTFTVSLLAYERLNGMGDYFGPETVTFVITAAAGTAPSITIQPATQAANAGATLTLGVAATGSPPPTFQWRKDGVALAGATQTTLTITNLQSASAGAYTVVVTNSGGSVTSAPAIVSLNAPATGVPAIAAHPQSQHVGPGSVVTLTVGATGGGLGYQWKKDGSEIGGATAASLVLGDVSRASAGFYAATITNTAGRADSAVATVTVADPGPSRIVNVSTRGFVPAGGTLTPGFVIQGDASKALVIRAVGPALAAFGLAGTLADPTMEVIPLGSTTPVAANDNWGGAAALVAAFARVGAFPISNLASNDASVATSLRATGTSGFSVRIAGKTATASGLALAEVYDEDGLTAPTRLLNVSTSGFVGTGDQALVPGFVIGGTAPKTLLIRAVGPGLAQFGVPGTLADPQLSVQPLGHNFAVVTNDNWGGDPALAAAFVQAGAFALAPASRDAAVVLRLPPGGYSVVVSGVGATTGTALVEIYDLDP
ncbi:MAG: immunoglobulin domain-containing protein [Opitutaceae bacterium]|nr:immunoglobulin domain-containing protein [Opitutaceae bacterium]